jgi:hypothetical protein
LSEFLVHFAIVLNGNQRDDPAFEKQPSRAPWALEAYGHALIKVFRGAGFLELVKATRGRFAQGKAAEAGHFQVPER